MAPSSQISTQLLGGFLLSGRIVVYLYGVERHFPTSIVQPQG